MASLTDSIKTPFISIVHNQTGQLLANTFGDGDATVVSFRYKYDDEDDDICIIKLQMSEPKALDKMNIARGTSIQVIWGYLGGISSPVATVLVRDLTSKYGNNIIYTELECTDFLTYLKMARSADVGNGSIMDYLKAQVYGRYNIVVKDRSNYIYGQSRKEKTGEDGNISKFLARPDESIPIRSFDPLREIVEMLSRYKNDTVSENLENKVSPEGTWYTDELNVVREYMEKKIDIPTSNRSIFIVLQDIFKKCPMGPWFVSGRGDTLVIHNRDLGGAVYKEYRYKQEPGLLIDLQAKTKFENFEKESIAYSGMDAKDRKNFYIEDYRKTLKKLRNPKEILDDKSISKEAKKLELAEWVSVRFGGGYYKFGVERDEVRFLQDEKDKWFYTPGSDQRVRIRKPVDTSLYGKSPLKVPLTENINQPDPFVRDATNVAFDKNIVDPILKAYWYTLPLLTYEEAIAVTNNRQRELAMDKEEAKIILEGDPYLMDKHVIKISNLHSQHEGFYYIKKCEHVFTQQGYKTQIDALKVSTDAMINTYAGFDKEQYDPENEDLKILIEEQFKREQELFGLDLEIISYGNKAIGNNLVNFDPTIRTDLNASPVNVIKLSDILKEQREWQIDEFIDRFFEILDDDNVTIREIKFSPENR